MEIEQINLKLILFLLICCSGCVKTNNYETNLYSELEKTYEIEGHPQEFTFDLSTLYKIDWDTLFFIPTSLPPDSIKKATGILFNRGYERMILKKNNLIVFHDSLKPLDYEFFFDNPLNRPALEFRKANYDTEKEYRFYTDKLFNVRVSNKGELYFVLSPCNNDSI